MSIDLHIHSNCSDGSDNVEELAEKIKQAGIKIFALTDHDTVDGCEKMSKLMPNGFIPAVELTCLCDSIKCHILGYGINYKNSELLTLIKKGKVLRHQKLETRIQYLKDTWNFEFTPDELEWLYTRKSVVKTHLANILVKRGLAKDNLSAMEKYLDGCKTGNTRFEGAEAISTIKKAGGIVVWAHPLGGEGEKHLSEKDFLPKLEIMKGFGIQGLECYYSRYDQKEADFLAKCASDNKLFTTGGSDYHGTNKDIPLKKLNSENKIIEPEKITLISNPVNLLQNSVSDIFLL